MSVKIMSAVWDYHMPELTTDKGVVVPAPTAKNVLLRYANSANDYGEGAYEGQRAIAEKTQLSLQTVSNAVNALCYCGYIIYKGKSDLLTNNYSINCDLLGVLVARTRRSSGLNGGVPPTRTNPLTGGLIEIYEKEIGPITPLISEEILDWADDVGEKWVKDALREAASHDKRSWAYARSILRRWQKKGNQDPDKPAEKPSPAPRPRRKFPTIVNGVPHV